MNEIIQTISDNPEGFYVALGFAVVYMIWRAI